MALPIQPPIPSTPSASHSTHHHADTNVQSSPSPRRASTARPPYPPLPSASFSRNVQSSTAEINIVRHTSRCPARSPSRKYAPAIPKRRCCNRRLFPALPPSVYRSHTAPNRPSLPSSWNRFADRHTAHPPSKPVPPSSSERAVASFAAFAHPHSLPAPGQNISAPAYRVLP